MAVSEPTTNPSFALVPLAHLRRALGLIDLIEVALSGGEAGSVDRRARTGGVAAASAIRELLTPLLDQGAEISMSGDRSDLDAEAEALVNALEQEFSHNAATQFKDMTTEQLDVMYERRWSLIERADAIAPSSSKARHAKALALAWLDYVQNWTSGCQRSDLEIDGRLALDVAVGLATKDAGWIWSYAQASMRHGLPPRSRRSSSASR